MSSYFLNFIHFRFFEHFRLKLLSYLNRIGFETILNWQTLTRSKFIKFFRLYQNFSLVYLNLSKTLEHNSRHSGGERIIDSLNFTKSLKQLNRDKMFEISLRFLKPPNGNNVLKVLSEGCMRKYWLCNYKDSFCHWNQPIWFY